MLAVVVVAVVCLCQVSMSQGENITISGEGWTYWCVGTCESDKKTATEGGRVLMGGGTDVDEAFLWFINNSGGGDILVLRASGTDAYNDYILGLGDGKINSVATLLINGPGSPSSDPIILEKIRNCEALWFAGGDQWLYYSWWKDTPLIAAVQKLIDSNVTVGGTSAGMAIQSEFAFVAEYDTVDSPTALENPYDKSETIARGYLTGYPLQKTITDTHFGERDRMGRIVSFMARIMQDYKVRPLGIACDQSVAVLVDTRGIGRVVVGPSDEARVLRKAYFIVPTNPPAVCKPKTPLTFKNLEIHRLSEGDTWNFNTWSTTDGQSYTMSATTGVLSTEGNSGDIY